MFSEIKSTERKITVDFDILEFVFNKQRISIGFCEIIIHYFSTNNC